jgi:(p)ppGpp synthase/HD superfamily hydrolase
MIAQPSAARNPRSRVVSTRGRGTFGLRRAGVLCDDLPMDARVPAPGYSPRLDRALAVAAIAHDGQVRRGTAVPVVAHAFHVAMVLERHGFPEEVVVAGVLHDVLEDIRPEDPRTRAALAETLPGLAHASDDPGVFLAQFEAALEAACSGEVLALVRGVTHARDVAGRRLEAEEWRALKLDELRRPETPVAVLALKAADVIHNSRSIASDLRARGPIARRRFRTTPAATLQWYADVVAAARPRLAVDHPALADELADAVAALARELEDQLEPAPGEGRRRPLEELER